MEPETKEVETKERITYGDVHICLTCEHRGTCRFAGAVESISSSQACRGGNYEVSIPEMHDPEDRFPELEVDVEGDDAAHEILAGVRVCPRHSGGDPRYTHGIIG